jgi:hypothetical protein
VPIFKCQLKVCNFIFSQIIISQKIAVFDEQDRHETIDVALLWKIKWQKASTLTNFRHLKRQNRGAEVLLYR